MMEAVTGMANQQQMITKPVQESQEAQKMMMQWMAPGGGEGRGSGRGKSEWEGGGGGRRNHEELTGKGIRDVREVWKW